MPLLIEATINDVMHRVSTDSVALEHYWEPYVISFDAPNFDATNDYGGFCEITFGSICFHPDLFSGDWFPPDKIQLDIKYTDSTEATAVVVFVAVGYLSKVDNDSITYDIRNAEYTKNVLAECIDYDGNENAIIPYVIGTIQHANPTRTNETTYPQYRIDGIILDNPEIQIRSIEWYDFTYTRINTYSDHGFVNNDSVIISDTGYYDGTYTIYIDPESADTKTFLIVKMFDPGVTTYRIDSFGNYVNFGDFTDDSFEDGLTYWDTHLGTFTAQFAISTVVSHVGMRSLIIDFNYPHYVQELVRCSIQQKMAYWLDITDIPVNFPVEITFSLWVLWNNPFDLYVTIVEWNTLRNVGVITVSASENWQNIEVTAIFTRPAAWLDVFSPRISFTTNYADLTGSDELLYVDGPMSVTSVGYTLITLDDSLLENPFIANTDCAILGSDNYDGRYTALYPVSEPHTFAIEKTYIAEPTIDAKAFIATDAITVTNAIGHVVNSTTLTPFRIYDNGVPITNNYVASDFGAYQSFGLSAEPVGVVTISGTGSLTTLNDVLDAAATVAGITYDNTSARVVSPGIAEIINTQNTIIDYISAICEFYTHISYVLDGVLYAVDCKRANQANPSGIELTEHEFFNANYYGKFSLNEIKSEWTVQRMTVQSLGSSIYLLETIERAARSNLTLISSGIITEIEAYKLIDDSATFVTDGILADMFAKNYDTGEIASVTVIDSETELTLDEDLFSILKPVEWESGTVWATGIVWGFNDMPSYMIGSMFSSGDDLVVEAHHQEVANVQIALYDIQSILVSYKIEIHLPMNPSKWILPGDMLKFTDTKKPQDLSVEMKVRSLKYDFDNYTLIASGEGTIS